MKFSIFKNKFILVAGLAMSLSMMAKNADAGLMITPNRVDLDEKNISKEVKLINKGAEVTTYRVSFQHLRMKKDGSYEEIKDAGSGEKFADDLVTYSPKQVTLKPGEVQTVRLMFKKREDLKEGEYRSHMLFKEEVPADFGNDIEKKAKKDKTISVVLKPVFGVTIPVVVTKGNLSATANIENVVVKNDKLSLKLTRSGEASLFGDVVVTFTDKDTNKKHNVGTLNNIAVFFPYPERDLLIKLNVPKGINLSNGSIEVTYYGKNSELVTDKNKVLAKKIVN